MPASTAAPPFTAAGEEDPFALFFLQPLFLHGFGAATHLLVALTVAGHLVSRRCGPSSAAGRRAKDGRRAFRCYGVAACATWAMAPAEVLSAAYSCYFYLGGGGGWSRDAVAALADAAARGAAWLLLAAYLQFEFGRRRRREEERFPAPLRLWWALFLLLSALSLAAHVATSLHGLPVPALTWALDAVSVLGAVVLLAAGLLGRREGGVGPAAEEPLLNGAQHEADDSNETRSGSPDASPFTGAGYLSALSFSWMGPLLAVGHKKTLGLDDVPGLDPGDSVAALLPTFKTNLESLAGGNNTTSASASGARKAVTAFKLTKALVRTVWWHVAVTAFYALVYNVATYVGPYLIDALVQYLNGDHRYATRGQLLVVAFVVAKAFECVSQRHWFFRLQQAGIRARAALVAVVYQKGLALSSRSRQSRTSGEMINIISVDADRVGLFSWYMHDLWLVPLQVGMALFILYSTLGLASLAALAATVVVMLANVPPGQMQEKFQQKLMDCKDVRMKATSEILRNMRILKLQGWEMKFLSKIIDLRKTETNWLKKYLYTSTMVTFVFWGAPTFVAVVTFGACMLMGIPLESGKVLSALATFRVLQEPIYNLPDTISMVIQTKVSLDRIASFLCLEELPADAVQRLPSGSSDVAIEVTNGNFSWEASPEELTLKELNFQARKGMLVAVCGTVGSGKSSLLSSILGEIPKVSGEVKTCGTTANACLGLWLQKQWFMLHIRFEFLPAADLILLWMQWMSQMDGGDVASASNDTSKLSKSLSSAEKKDEQDEKNAQSGQLVQEEEREKGRVGFWVYWKYLTLAYKGALVPFVLLAQILFQVLQIASNYWMAWAAPVSKDVEPPVSMPTLIYVFVALSVGSSFCVLIRALFLVAWQVFVIFIPVVAACFWYQRYYIDTARELQRLVGVCKAPIIQHFAESITGSTTIRSFGKENQFVSSNSHLMDAYSRPKFYNAGAMEWLCFRLDVLSSLTFAFSLVFLINLPPGLIDPGIAGLAVTYGLNLNMLQAWVVKYAPQLPFVLKGLTVTFPGGLKTGIVGRTGSGKSTLIQALFRIVDPTIGSILIDGVDICTIGLHDLRFRLSIIPQEPTMFEGTVRSNLDPLGEYTDNQIWEALDCCQLGDEVRKKELKLDSPVIENGDNWSVGQRQLVCLGRVILKRSKILVLDEATASVDTATDNLIHKTLRQQFSEATVITIAHRITSVLDSDMVLLLDNGVAVERNTPSKLLEDKSSLFSKLVAEYTMRSTHT
ncbi:hypothetical protein PR202_ga23315 [Eleusine coracana subsp. coracana]|uniref:ABC transporter C family member 3 n=1 Tax=Eleusine coracana subsp. coracana TaxID=191504 RepID=A0AAV5D6J1_ELECO|nr:hypothetical protein PR202_ga23315 [Eleusine coracana subsp. coracana]